MYDDCLIENDYCNPMLDFLKRPTKKEEALTEDTQITWQGHSVTVKRSARRKHRAIQISQGQVVVRLPMRDKNNAAVAILNRKQRWVEKKLAQVKQIKLPSSELSVGSDWWFKGKPVALAFADEKQLSESTLSIQTNQDVYQQIVALYRAAAQVHVTARVSVFSKQMGLSPKGIEIKAYKARWGSCTRQGMLQFSWKLMQCSSEVIDYVVVHELAHLVHFNHSHAFWALVAQYCPAYKTHRAWLKRHADLLRI